jgi:drug/metabolite transporter (DMT)-like permease
MMNGSVVAATAILSMVFLKKQYFRQHWTGIVSIVCGVAIVGYGGMKKASNETPTTLLGVIITLCSQVVYGGVYVVDEAIFRKYKAHPLKLMSWEGMFGVPIYILILVILQLIPCN